MCIKVHRWYCCPVPKDQLSNEKPLSKSQSDPDVPMQWKYGERVPPDEISELGLVRYSGFIYVRHSVVSWIRCATWTSEDCNAPDTAVHVRHLAFRRTCPSCSGYDKCLSQFHNAYLVQDDVDSKGLSDLEQSLGFYQIAENALDCVLRTEASRYLAIGVPFFVSKNFTHGWVFRKPAARDLIPFVYPLLCTEETEHIGPTTDMVLGICSCTNGQLDITHNPLRYVYRDSAEQHNQCRRDISTLLDIMWDRGFFDEAKDMFVPTSREQEWLGTSTEYLGQASERLQTCYRAIEECSATLLQNSGEALGLEESLGRTYKLDNLSCPWTIISRRTEAARFVASLICSDPGLPPECLPFLVHFLCSIMYPYRAGNTNIPILDAYLTPDEDLSIIQAFVGGVDYWNMTTSDIIRQAYERESRFTLEMKRLTNEMVENLEHVHSSFFQYVWRHIIPAKAAHKVGGECYVCTEPWVKQDSNVPDFSKTIKMPCCGHLAHVGCLQGVLCTHPELHRTPACPLCRTDMRTHGWFAMPQLENKIVLSRERPSYEPPPGFITVPVFWNYKQLDPSSVLSQSDEDEDDDEDDDDEASSSDDSAGASVGSPMDID